MPASSPFAGRMAAKTPIRAAPSAEHLRMHLDRLRTRPRGLYFLFELKHDFAPDGLAKVEPAGKRHIRLHS